MNGFQYLHFRKLTVASLLLALLAGSFWTASFSTIAQSPSQRKINTKTFKDMPIVISQVRNLEKEQDWFRDLQIEVKNISDKPIYFIAIGIEFPDIERPPATSRADGLIPAKTVIGFPLKFGRSELGDLSKLATPDDVALKPGESYVFTIPASRVTGFEKMKKRMNISVESTKNITVRLDTISFGDGTGFVAGKKRAYKEKASTNRSSNGVFQKVKWGTPTAPASQTPNACGTCNPYYIDYNSGIFCTPTTGSPCEQDNAKLRSGEPCSRFAQAFFACGDVQLCEHDYIDDEASESCPTRTCNVSAHIIANCEFGGGYWNTDTCSCDAYTPLIIDVNGDGYRLTDAAGGVLFDIDGDSATERLSWTARWSDDALLALDRDNNGRIDSGKELFGNFTKQPASDNANGFIALAQYDDNGDGVIDSNDAVFASLRLWQDANHNGVSEPSELHSLQALDVVRLHLDYKESKRVDEQGNRFRYRAKVDDARGAKVGRWAWDVFLVKGQ